MIEFFFCYLIFFLFYFFFLLIILPLDFDGFDQKNAPQGTQIVDCWYHFSTQGY